MKAVRITVEGSVSEIDGEYESIKAAIDGWLEIAPTPGSPFVMLCDEEGKLKGKPFNERANTLADRFRDWEDPLVGDVVLVGLPDREGENTDFTLDDFLELDR
jgi:hypothetical protein